MSHISNSFTVRVQNSFAQLSAVATKLNNASGELGKVVSELDAALQRLNLGVSAWVDVSRENEGGGYLSLRKIGYARVGKQWGIALGVVNTHEFANDDERPDIWLFNDAPRWLRVEAVEKLPELFEKLAAEAVTTTEKIVAKTTQARELASAVNPTVGVHVGDLMQEIQYRVEQSVSRNQAIQEELEKTLSPAQESLQKILGANPMTARPPQTPSRKK